MDRSTARRDPTIVRGTLEAFRRRLARASDPAFMALFAELQQWIADQPVDGELEALGDSEYLARHFAFFAQCQRRYLTAQEVAESAALLAAPRAAGAALTTVLDSEFGTQTYRRVAEALELADFRHCRRFVMVGCGPFPAAALFIHDHTTTSEIVAMDKSPVAVEVASRVAAAFAPRRVRVIEDDGGRFDYGTADVVYVANHVSPKARVLQRIADTADANAQVIVRDPCGYGRLFAESGVADLDPRFVVTRMGEGHRHFLSRHVLLGRRDHSAPKS